LVGLTGGSDGETLGEIDGLSDRLADADGLKLALADTDGTPNVTVLDNCTHEHKSVVSPAVSAKSDVIDGSPIRIWIFSVAGVTPCKPNSIMIRSPICDENAVAPLTRAE